MAAGKRTLWRIAAVLWLFATSAACLLQAWASFAVLLGLLLVVSLWTAVAGFHYQGKIADRLRRDLGFRHGKRCVGWFGSVLTFDSVMVGGLFEQAEFRKGDVIVDDASITEFYKLLEEARGGEPVTITVSSCNDQRSSKNRIRRRLMVRVPTYGERARK
jgi:hypothetical protein